jgi:hypothetical protein
MELGGKDGRIPGYFQPFLCEAETKKRGTDRPNRASGKLGCQAGYSASFRMVGTKPMFGLPVGPWAVAIFMKDSEVLPQQSFFGQ